MYIIIDDDLRKDFEERYHIPYGYGDCYVYDNMENAMMDFKDIAEPGYLIEFYKNGDTEIVYTYDELKRDDVAEF